MIDILWNCYSKTGTFACTKTLCRCIVITNNNSIRFQRFYSIIWKNVQKERKERKYAEGISSCRHAEWLHRRSSWNKRGSCHCTWCKRENQKLWWSCSFYQRHPWDLLSWHPGRTEASCTALYPWHWRMADPKRIRCTQKNRTHW